MSFNLLYNGASGGAIRATIQQLTDSGGLGMLWSETLEAWTTASTPFNDRTTVVVGQTLGETAIAYFGQAVFNNTYSGKVIVGYHDTANNNEILFSEVRFVRRGVELSNVVATDRVQWKVSPSFVAHLSRRGDGKVVAMNDLEVADSDAKRFAYELSPLLQDGIHVADINTISVTPSGQMEVVALGGRDSQAVLEITGGQVSGTTYTVTCTALLSDADQIECNVLVKCKTPYA